MSEFFQAGPSPKGGYRPESPLRRLMQSVVPAEALAEIEGELEAFSERVVSEVEAYGAAANGRPPEHVPYDAWGKRIDEIKVSPGWLDLHRVAAEEGIVATAYERRQGACSRLMQMAKLYLYHPASAFYSCPLAMTDGAAKVLEKHGSSDADAQRAFEHLIARDPSEFWTSGQWMTEREGGSDVGRTATVALQQEGTYYGLSGTKWFSSATTSEIALALGRTDPDAPRSRGLSLFLVELRDDQGALNGITVNRLKDKLGTKALPTAELKLENTKAKLIGKPGGGVKEVTTMLNITRYYNSVCASAAVQRVIDLADDYSDKREAFGKKLSEHSLHTDTLRKIKAASSASTVFTGFVAHLLGKEEVKEEVGEASQDDLLLLRLMTPVLKLYTGKQAVALTSEAIEVFGGAAYVEDTGLPLFFRDAQVFPLWEGTTNVLSLDLLRVLIKQPEAAKVLLKTAKTAFDAPALRELEDTGPARGIAEELLQTTSQALATMQKLLESGDRSRAESLARNLALVIGDLYIAKCFAELIATTDGGLREAWTEDFAVWSSERVEHVVLARRIHR